MGITLSDIAKHCGVSSATASMIVNGKTKRFSDATISKVEKAIKELNYTPNYAARTMVTNTTNTIGLVVTDVSDHFFGRIAKGVSQITNECGYDLLLASTDGSLKKEQDYIKVFKSRGVDGIIFAPLNTVEEDEAFEQLFESGYPFVTIERYLSNTAISSVKMNNYQGMFDLTKMFINKGHKRLAFITGPMSVKSSRLRYRGFIEAHKDSNLTIDSSLVYLGDYSYESGVKVGKEFLKHYTPDITGVIASNNDMEYGFYEVLKDAGIILNKDISIAGGGGGIAPYPVIEPKFTSIDASSRRLGLTATKMLISLLKKEKLEENNIVLDLDIQDRGSIQEV